MHLRLTLAALALPLLSLAQQGTTYERRQLLAATINTTDDEGGAILSQDGLTLYFVRSTAKADGSPDQDIFRATRASVADNFGQAMLLPEIINNKLPNTVAGIGGNGLFLNNIYRKDGKMSPGLSFAPSTGTGTFSEPQEVKVNETFPTEGYLSSYVTPDGATVIVSLNKADGMGEEDLYYAEKDGSGNFGALQSLGVSINTSGFETSPVLSADKQTLYFTSSGHQGQGGGDIFMARRLGAFNQWSKPENLGPKINTGGYDGSFNLGPDSVAVFVSGEGSGGSGDVYAISMKRPLPPPPPPALPVDTTPQTVVTPPTPPTPPKSPDAVPTVLFAFNSAAVTAEQAQQVAEAARKLRKKKLKLEVSGFTDEVGTEEYNIALSKKRAQVVKQLLIKAGIPASRIIAKGYGELNPASNNSSDEGRAQNRRTEVRLSY